MAEQVFLFPTGFDPPTSGVISGGVTGELFGLLLPAILLATIVPVLLQIAEPSGTAGTTGGTVTATTVTAAPTPCPVCAAPVTCTTPAPCMPIPACPTDFIKLSNGGTEIPNKCYLFLQDVENYMQMLGLCTIKGGTLSNPMTEDEGLAIKAWLLANDPGTYYFFGYTDLANRDIMAALSGGDFKPIPGLNVDGDTGITNDKDDCTIIAVTSAGNNDPGTEFCENSRKAVCEVNLSNQKCICP